MGVRRGQTAKMRRMHSLAPTDVRLTVAPMMDWTGKGL